MQQAPSAIKCRRPTEPDRSPECDRQSTRKKEPGGPPKCGSRGRQPQLHWVNVVDSSHRSMSGTSSTSMDASRLRWLCNRYRLWLQLYGLGVQTRDPQVAPPSSPRFACSGYGKQNEMLPDPPLRHRRLFDLTSKCRIGATIVRVVSTCCHSWMRTSF